MLFDWLVDNPKQPTASRVTLFSRALDAWWDDPEVCLACTAFKPVPIWQACSCESNAVTNAIADICQHSLWFPAFTNSVFWFYGLRFAKAKYFALYSALYSAVYSAGLGGGLGS